MKQIGANVVALALTAFAAAGVSAQSGGMVTAVPATASQGCVVAGAPAASFRTTTDANGTYVTTVDGQKIATITHATAGAVGVGGFGGGHAVTITSDNADANAVTAVGTLRATTESGAGVNRIVRVDGSAEPVTVASYMMKRAADGTTTLESVDGKPVDSKEAAKFHVKRPTNGTMTYAAGTGENAVTMRAATGQAVMLDGTAAPVACKIIVRQTDGGGN